MTTRAEIEEKLEEILPLVGKPGRYTGGELNSVVKDHESSGSQIYCRRSRTPTR